MRSHRDGEEFIRRAHRRYLEGSRDSNSNLAKSARARPRGTLILFSTRPPGVCEQYEGSAFANTHIFFRANVHSRKKAVRFPLSSRKREYSLSKNRLCRSSRQALRLAPRCVTCRLTLYCRGNGYSDPTFHSNITVRRQIRLAIGVKRLEGRTERGLCSDDI